MTDVFFALSDPTRREIVRLLRSSEHSAGELAQAFPLAKSTLSAHFRVLKQAGLVTAERRRTSIVYRLNVSVVEAVVATLLGWLGGRGARPPMAAAAGRATEPRSLPRRSQRANTDAVHEVVVEGPTRAQVVRAGAGLVLLAGGAAAGAISPAPAPWRGAPARQPGRGSASQRTTRRLGLRLLQPAVA